MPARTRPVAMRSPWARTSPALTTARPTASSSHAGVRRYSRGRQGSGVRAGYRGAELLGDLHPRPDQRSELPRGRVHGPRPVRAPARRVRPAVPGREHRARPLSRRAGEPHQHRPPCRRHPRRPHPGAHTGCRGAARARQRPRHRRHHRGFRHPGHARTRPAHRRLSHPRPLSRRRHPGPPDRPYAPPASTPARSTPSSARSRTSSSSARRPWRATAPTCCRNSASRTAWNSPATRSATD